MDQSFASSTYVVAPIAYYDEANEHPRTLVYPESSGLGVIRPTVCPLEMHIHDCRGATEAHRLDTSGFELHSHRSSFTDFYDELVVKSHYYPEVVQLLQERAGAFDVIAFDHNTRSAVRSAAGQRGVRAPVENAHVDYTPTSGPKRCLEILEDAGKSEYSSRRLALINVWRPIIGPVEDHPLAVCDERSTVRDDFIEVEIHHFAEEDLETPRHSGRVYSLRHNTNHRWYFVSSMQPDEVLFLKGYDSESGRACFTPHTGFRNPARAAEFTPRESIEVRTLVVY